MATADEAETYGSKIIGPRPTSPETSNFIDTGRESLHSYISVNIVATYIRQRKIFLLFLCATTVPCCWCIEEYQREIFLGPRNFNPHPYEHQLARIQDPGPVTFPRTEDENDPNINNRYNIITVDRKRAKHPIDDHPYSKVAEKVKYLSRKKYRNDVENQIDPEIYDALTQQGTNVLTYPAQDLKNYGGASDLQKKNYAFAYKVLDKGSGDDFSHQQIRNSKATNGEYRVKLPDGRTQIVSYKADKDGYKADVKYEDDPEFTHQNIIHGSDIHQYPPQHVDVQRVPVRELKPRYRQPVNSYDYAAEEGEQQLISPLRDPNVVVLEQAGPTQIPVKYVDVSVAPSPSPEAFFFEEAGHHGYQNSQHNPNVQIYTTNPRDHLQGNYVSSTAATPSHEKGVVRYTSTPVPPVQAQVGHIGDHGIFLPVISSTYAPAGGQSLRNHKNVIARPDVSGRIGGSVYHQTLAQEDELPEGIYIVGKPNKRKK